MRTSALSPSGDLAICSRARPSSNREQTLAAPPPNAGEVCKRSAFCHQDCREIVLTHQLARFFLPIAAFVDGNGCRFAVQRLELGHSRWKWFVALRTLSKSGKRCGGGGNRTGLQESAAREQWDLRGATPLL